MKKEALSLSTILALLSPNLASANIKSFETTNQQASITQDDSANLVRLEEDLINLRLSQEQIDVILDIIVNGKAKSNLGDADSVFQKGKVIKVGWTENAK